MMVLRHSLIMTNIDSESLANKIVGAIKNVVGENSVNLHEPVFAKNEKIYLNECIDSTFVSSVGKFVDKFEDDLASYTKCTKATAVVNGTSALHLGLILAGVERGDEVLMPSLTFVATANAVSYCGAVPHFVDSSYEDLGIDAGKLRKYLHSLCEIKNGICFNKKTGRIIKAIIPMHAYGNPSNIIELVNISNEFNIVLIEDAAESLGSFVGLKHTGSFGLLGILSFNGNKTITTGGGGAIITDNEEIAYKAKHLSTTAKLSHKWSFVHDKVGFNYRMPNLNAALGCAQLENLPNMLAQKRKLFHAYEDVLSDIKGLRILKESKGCKSNYWLQTIILDEHNKDALDTILSITNDNGIGTRPTWALMHHLPMYKDCPRADLSTSESLEKRIINIPSSSFLLD